MKLIFCLQIDKSQMFLQIDTVILDVFARHAEIT